MPTPPLPAPADHGPSDSRLTFLHIPKTAGTTLWLILRRQYPALAVQRSDDCSPLSTLTAQQLGDLRVLVGHFPFGADQPPAESTTYITILREPLERVLSHYCHGLRYHSDRSGDAVPDLLDYADNLQTRMLAGKEAMALPYGGVDRGVFELAKKHLTGGVTVAGLTERFDEAVVMFQRMFGWKRPYYVPENIGANRIQRDQIPRQVLQEVWQQTRWDRELYASAVARFEAQVAEQGAGFADDLRRLRIMNVRYKRLKALTNAGPLRTLKSSLSLERRTDLDSLVRTGLAWTSAASSPALHPIRPHTRQSLQSSPLPELPILMMTPGEDLPRPHGH